MLTWSVDRIAPYLNGVGDLAGIVQNGELGILELHRRGAEVGVVLVLTLKLLVERVVISTRKTARENREGTSEWNEIKSSVFFGIYAAACIQSHTRKLKFTKTALPPTLT